MRALLCFEELEVEKLKQQETQAKEQGPEAQEAHEEQAVSKAVDELATAQAEEESTDDMSSEGDGADAGDGFGGDGSDPSGDGSDAPSDSDPAADDSTDPEEGDNKDDSADKESDKKSDDDELEQAKECFANFGHYRIVSLEDYMDYETGAATGELALKGVKAGYEAAAWVGKSLWSLGVEYGPGIVTAVFKGVLYTMAKLGQGLGAMYSALAKAAAKRKASISVLSKEIADLKEAIEKIKSSKDQENTDKNEGGAALYNKVDTIDSFKIGDQVSPLKSLAVLNKYLSKSVAPMAQAAVDDLNGLRRMTQVIGSPTEQDITSALSVSLDRSGFKHGSVVEEKLDSYAVEELYYPETLPGDMILRLVLPVSKLRNPEEYEQAFDKSSLELHFNKGNYRSVQNVPVLSLAQVEQLVKPLEETLGTLKKQESLYSQIEHTKPGVMTTAKNHLLGIARSKAKIPLDKSMAEPMYLKAKFVSTVYLTGLTESHIYSAKVMTSVIAYCHYSLFHQR